MECSKGMKEVFMKKKVLVFHPIIAPYRIDFFNAIAEYYDAKVVLYWRNLKDQTFDYAKIESQFVFKPEYCVKEEIGTFQWLKRIWHYLNVERPEKVFVCEYGIITLLVLAHRFITRFKYKIVCHTDDSYNMLADDNHFTIRHKIAIRVFAPLIDEFINVEPQSAQWYQERYGKGIYFPIIVDEHKSARRYGGIIPLSEKYVQDYQLKGKKVLLFVGRLVELKNLQLVIESLKDIQDPDLKLIIVGTGDYESRLKELAKDDERITFVGRKEGDELYAWYNIANVFVLASYQEAFGAVTNEALLGGCLCLISKNAGSKCLIEKGVNGYTIDPYNSQDLKKALLFALARVDAVQLPLGKRKNLMQISFNDMMNNLFERL